MIAEGDLGSQDVGRPGRNPDDTEPPSGRGTSSAVVRIEPGLAELNERAFARRRRISDNILRWGTPLVLLGVWEVASRLGWLDDRFYPSPTQILNTGIELTQDGILQEATVTTVRRMLIGYTMGCAAGVFIGLILGAFRPLRIAFEPIVHALYTVPKLALLPLLLLIMGIGEGPIIVLIAVTVFFVTCISTLAGVQAVPRAYIEASRSLRSSRLQMFRHVVLPATLPSVVVALKLSAGIAVLVVIGVEFVHGGDGLGHLIWNSWQLFLADRMYVGIVVVAIIGVVFQSIVGWLGRLLVPWAETDTLVEI